jgi:hypothetical protein
MVLSQGKLSLASNLKVSQEGGHLLFQLNMVLLSVRSSLQVIETVTQRKAGQAMIPFSGGANEIPEDYVFWLSGDNRSFSTSVYWKCS